jgi:hypothetical protein
MNHEAEIQTNHALAKATGSAAEIFGRQKGEL